MLRLDGGGRLRYASQNLYQLSQNPRAFTLTTREMTSRILDVCFSLRICSNIDCFPFFSCSAGTISITITLFNKAVFSYYGFKFPLTLFVAQMLFSLLFVSGLKFISPERFGFPNFQFATAKKVLYKNNQYFPTSHHDHVTH